MKTTQPVEQRAKDAVARALIDMLNVPNVYFDAPWPNGKSRVDVLVIDRAGSGDVHVVEIERDFKTAITRIPRLMRAPAQFRWLAHPLKDSETDLNKQLAAYDRAQKAPLFASKGIGRVGVIFVVPEEDRHGELLDGEIAVRAERFAGSHYDLAEKFVANHVPDIMFR